MAPPVGASTTRSAASDIIATAPHPIKVFLNISTIGRTVYVPNNLSLASISGSLTYTCPSYHPVSSYSTVALSNLSRTYDHPLYMFKDIAAVAPLAPTIALTAASVNCVDGSYDPHAIGYATTP